MNAYDELRKIGIEPLDEDGGFKPIQEILIQLSQIFLEFEEQDKDTNQK